MSRRPRARVESDALDDSEQEEEQSSNEEDDGSSESGLGSDTSSSDGSRDEESGEDEDEEDEDAGKLVRVARDVEQMRSMCEEMDKIKLRLQFRLDAAREGKQDALRREAEQREQVERHQAAAADVDAPQAPAPPTVEPEADERPPSPPVQVLKADVFVQTDCDMVAMDRMEANFRAPLSPVEKTIPTSPSKPGTFRMDSAISKGARVLPAAVDDRSPGLSIYDLDKSNGVDGGREHNAASAFYDHVLTGMSHSKKMGTIPSVSSDSDRSAAPDQQSWPSISGHHAENSVTHNGTLRTAKSSFDNRPTTAERANHYSFQGESAGGSHQYADQQSLRTSHGLFDAQDSLRAPLSPSSTASADKTDEQRELEAIQSLLFGR